MASCIYMLDTPDAETGAILTFVAAMGALLISYARARAEAAGYKASVGLLARPERVIDSGGRTDYWTGNPRALVPGHRDARHCIDPDRSRLARVPGQIVSPIRWVNRFGSVRPRPRIHLRTTATAQIGEDEVNSAARSCMAIVLILGALLVVAIIFALVALLA